MQTKFNKSEKVWHVPELSIHYTGLGQAILSNLKKDDPKRVLEVHHDTGEQLTVEQIRHQTIAVAQNLVRLGVEKGDRIILYSMVNAKVTPITFACYTIGAPINFFETKFQGDEISHYIGLLDPSVIIYEEEYKPQLFKALSRLNLSNLKHVLSIDSEIEPIDDVLFKPVAGIKDFQAPDIGDPTQVTATLMLTSGSTGRPKIVQHSHAIMMQGLYTWWELERGNRIFCFSPLRWISQVILMMQPIFFGVQRIYASKLPSPVYVKDIIEAHKVTHFFTVPAIYLRLLRAAEELKDFSSIQSLKIALVGGEVVSEALVAFSAKVLPNCRLVKCYGMTELAGCIASDESLSKCPVNGGVLKSGLSAKVIDSDGKSLGPDENGRLCLKSTVPFLGYFKSSEVNQDGFMEDGWFSTGDYGCMNSDNLLHIVTRYKYLVRSGDTIVIPSNVENIVNLQPNVLASALVGHPGPRVPTEEVGTVFVVLRGNSDSNSIEAELKQFLGERISKEELQIIRHFKVIPEMPLTSCGKVDATALREMAKGG